MIHYGLSDLTVTGTCLEYGLQEGRLSEDMPALPITAYGKAKNKLRNELEKIKGKAGLNFKWVRLFYMYGKGQNPNSLLSQLDKALSNEEKIFNMSGGRQLRDFLPVEKVAKNIVTIALQRNVEGIINCSSAEPLAVLDFVRKYLRQKGKDIALNPGYYPYPDYEPMGFWGDNTKLKSIIKE